MTDETEPRAAAERLIRAYYAAFNAKDWAGMLGNVAEDVRHHVNEGAARDGRERFAAFLAHMDRCYDERLTEVVAMAAADGRRAAAEFVVEGVYRATDGDLPPARGQSYRLPAGAFFEIADGRIVRVTTYYNLRDWLAQVA